MIDMPYATEPTVELVDGREALNAAGKAVRFKLPGIV